MPLVLSPVKPSSVIERRRIRFDRNELSGAFGDIGTDFPLIAGMILAANLRPANVLTLFGGMQILTGLLYGMPMPAQPLKAMAVIVISHQASAPVLFGGGLAIGILMLVLALTGLLTAIARAVPKSVVRGIQFGLGLQLASIALRDYIAAEGRTGFILAAIAFVITLLLLGNRRLPPAIPVLGLGLVFALVYRVSPWPLLKQFHFAAPQPQIPGLHDIWLGFIVLAIPQFALSLGNSILATQQIVTDLFPERSVTVKKVGLTYAVMNLINPFFGGVPTCHGSGGMAGHYTFGARTGGSVIIYGTFYLILGLFFSAAFQNFIPLFPKAILGTILLFEAVALMVLCRDMAIFSSDFVIILVVALCALALPYGYVVGLLVGIALHYLFKDRLKHFARDPMSVQQ
jgi:MFS superfamily sulfate permease-like transporter